MASEESQSTYIGANLEETAFVKQFYEIKTLTDAARHDSAACQAVKTTVGSENQTHSAHSEVPHDVWASRTVNPLGTPEYHSTTPTSNGPSFTTLEEQLTERFHRYFQHGSTMPLNGFLDERGNFSGETLKCISCLCDISENSKSRFVPWEPPQERNSEATSSLRFYIHLQTCFKKLYERTFFQAAQSAPMTILDDERARLMTERETHFGLGSPGDVIDFTKINRDHWDAGLRALRDKTLRIEAPPKAPGLRDGRPLPDDRDTCLSCLKRVVKGDAFRYAQLPDDRWKRRYHRRYMLHAGCVDQKDQASVEESLSRSTRSAEVSQ